MSKEQLQDRLMKLLSLTTSPHDPEALAAIRKINVIMDANDVSWEELLNGHELSRDEMQNIYDAGYAAGEGDHPKKSELFKKAEPNWQSTAGVGRTIGDKIDYLKDVLLASKHCSLTAFESEFCKSMIARVARYGNSSYVTEKQWAVIDRMNEKFTG